MNANGLSTTNRTDDGVELVYRHDSESPLVQELERLVVAEQDCCGAAGVKFELARLSDGSRVTVSVVEEGLPSRTVIAAFAAMA